MSTRSSFRAALERPGVAKAGAPNRSASSTTKLLLSSGPILRPVDVIRLLAQHGLALKKARAVVDRLGAGERVPVELTVASLKMLIADLQRLGVSGRTFRELNVDVRRVRESQHLSQAEFASLYNLELDTLQNWEQGRNIPDIPTMALLQVIEQCPHVVLDALTESIFEEGDQQRDSSRAPSRSHKSLQKN